MYLLYIGAELNEHFKIIYKEGTVKDVKILAHHASLVQRDSLQDDNTPYYDMDISNEEKEEFMKNLPENVTTEYCQKYIILNLEERRKLENERSRNRGIIYSVLSGKYNPSMGVISGYFGISSKSSKIIPVRNDDNHLDRFSSSEAELNDIVQNRNSVANSAYTSCIRQESSNLMETRSTLRHQSTRVVNVELNLK